MSSLAVALQGVLPFGVTVSLLKPPKTPKPFNPNPEGVGDKRDAKEGQGMLTGHLLGVEFERARGRGGCCENGPLQALTLPQPSHSSGPLKGPLKERVVELGQA
jgi:hypothetical protein